MVGHSHNWRTPIKIKECKITLRLRGRPIIPENQVPRRSERTRKFQQKLTHVVKRLPSTEEENANTDHSLENLDLEDKCRPSSFDLPFSADLLTKRRKSVKAGSSDTHTAREQNHSGGVGKHN